jgi:valyl-tRNA synthetase
MSKSLGNVIDPLYLIDGASQEKMESTLRSGNLPKDELNRYKKYCLITICNYGTY